MGAQGFLTAFALLSCLGAGVLCLQGVAAARYRGERLNVAAAGVALVCAVVALVCFALRLGHWERLFGGFSNLTSPITLLLFAWVLFVAAAVVMLVCAARSEDGSVPRWCGVLAVVAGVVLAVCCALATHPYNKVTALTPDMWVLVLYYLACAGTLGSFGSWALGAARGEDTAGHARLALGCVAANAVLLGIYLGVFSLDHQAARTASQAVYAMATFTVGGTSGSVVGAAERVGALLAGPGAALFWVGAVGVGLVVPATAGAVALARPGARVRTVCAWVGLACALAGFACCGMGLAALT